MDNNEKQVKPVLIFTEYNKISDILLWLGSSKFALKFNVNLNKKDQNNNNRSFHNEFGYYSSSTNSHCISIRRDYSYFYSIEKSGSLDNSIMLKSNDVEILKIGIKDRMYPWFFGTKNVYGINQSQELCLKRQPKPFQLILSQSSYISFSPIVYYYKESNDMKQGVRIEINNVENNFDISIDTFLQFTSIILNTDMVNAAMNMINYVKIKPYGVNYYEMNKEDKGKKGFFQ